MGKPTIDLGSAPGAGDGDPARTAYGKTNEGLEHGFNDDEGGEIAALTAKTTLADADLILIEDSAASNAKKKVTRANLVKPVSGTFVPTIQDGSESNLEGQAYSEQTGVYRKTGDVVDFWVDMTVTSLGSLNPAQAVRIAGLPFTVANLSLFPPVQIGFCSGMNITAGESLTAIAIDGANNFQPLVWDVSTGNRNMLISEFSATGRITAYGRYIAA